MSGEVLIRDASAADVPAVAAIGREALPAQYEALVDPAAIEAAVAQTYSEPALTECIRRCVGADRACFLVAERGDRVVGFLHFDSFGPEPELHRLYAEPRARGAGVGSALMRALHHRLPSDSPYVLLVVAGNHRAIAFYERHGLRTEAQVDGLAYYHERMGVEFPRGTGAIPMVLMRRGKGGRSG